MLFRSLSTTVIAAIVMRPMNRRGFKKLAS
jgi:hypothetical protein